MKAANAPAIVPPTISDADFLKFREFFYRKTGIHFEESKRYFVDKRLIERIEHEAGLHAAAGLPALDATRIHRSRRPRRPSPARWIRR